MQPGIDYSLLNRAQLTFDYLHTNSTTHEFIFGALAELVDNSRDAGSENLYIYAVPNPELRGGQMIHFLDDGCGMDPEETINVVSFGKSDKRGDNSSAIGQYGNGLKSGSMRVANDFILFTKKNNAFTCLFLSRTFHEDENIKEVVVPIPSFDVQSGEPLLISNKTMAKHDLEMQLILKYSPFHDQKSFMDQFHCISGRTGTMIILYNLKLLDSGKPELDVTTCAQDIRLTCSNSADREAHDSLQPEWQSFREYVSILYYDPRMKVHLQGKKVVTKKLISMLYKPRVYKYTSNRFKARAEQELQRAQDDLLSVTAKVRELESRVVDTEQRLDRAGKLRPSERTELNKNRMVLSDLKALLEKKKSSVEAKQRVVKEPKMMQFIFGLNIDARRQDGMFVYNNSRLIRMYEKVGRQMANDIMYAGVVGVVNIPLMILEPTHNKQNFADRQEYKMLLKAMKEHMEQYWQDTGLDKRNMIQFWMDYGYDPDHMDEAPSDEPRFVRKRRMLVSRWIQCDNCLKWRKLAFSKDVASEIPENWICSMNSDATQNRCSLPEKAVELEEGKLQKVAKSREAECAIIKSKMEKLRRDMEKASSKVFTKRDVNATAKCVTASDLSCKPKPQKKRKLSSSPDYSPPRGDTRHSPRISKRVEIALEEPAYKNGHNHREDDSDQSDHQPCSDLKVGSKVRIFTEYGGESHSAKVKRIDQANERIRVRLLSGDDAERWLQLKDRDIAWAVVKCDKTRTIDRPDAQLENLSPNAVEDVGGVEAGSSRPDDVRNLLSRYRCVLLRLVPESCKAYRTELETMTDDELMKLSPSGLLSTFDRDQSKRFESWVITSIRPERLSVTRMTCRTRAMMLETQSTLTFQASTAVVPPRHISYRRCEASISSWRLSIRS